MNFTHFFIQYPFFLGGLFLVFLLPKNWRKTAPIGGSGEKEEKRTKGRQRKQYSRERLIVENFFGLQRQEWEKMEEKIENKLRLSGLISIFYPCIKNYTNGTIQFIFERFFTYSKQGLFNFFLCGCPFVRFNSYFISLL